MDAPRFYVVDASIYIFRSWYTMPDTLVDGEGEPANAVHGFADFLQQLLQRVRPSHLAIAFDESLEDCQRRQIYPAYKANREPAPEALRRQFGLCRKLVRAAGLPEFASPLVEADDIIATLAAGMRAHGHACTVITGDKDLAQVVTPGDEWWDFARDRRLDVRGVEKHFGVRPDQIADLLAIGGDRVDNIPGVPGIGTATAARLLRKWNDLDTLYDNLDGVKRMQIRGAARICALLAEHEDDVRLARRLTGTLVAEGLPEEPDAMAIREPDLSALADCLERLAFSPGRRGRLTGVLEQLGEEISSTPG